MKRAIVMLALVPGCYLGAHAGLDTKIHRRASAATAPEGAIDLGIGGSDDRSSGALLLGVGVSPLAARDGDASAPRTAIFSFGGRYEHAFTGAHPGVRGFGRLLLGLGACADASDMMTTPPDPSCATPAQRRSVTLSSFALGVVLTNTQHGHDHGEIVPSVASVGVAVVYSYATDDALGAADFVGLELSVGVGGDVVTPLTRRDGH